MTQNRTQIAIIASILLVVADKPKKTQIMYGANLSYTLLQKYLAKLIRSELVGYIKESRTYKLTKKGEAYLRAYIEYEKLKDISKSNESMLRRKESILNEIVESHAPTRARTRSERQQPELATP